MRKLVVISLLITFCTTYIYAGIFGKKQDLVIIETDFGDMVVRLYDETPLHKANFLKLVDEGFYDSTTFHRVISNFMIQGGDPNSKDNNPNNDGQGGPGYRIPAEFNPNLFHKKGALSAARQGDAMNPEKESSGSQFYVVQGKPMQPNELGRLESFKGIKLSEEQKRIYTEVGGTPHLDMDYTVFGEVIDGMDVIDKIASVKTNRANRPQKNVYMKMKHIRMKEKKIKKQYGYSFESSNEKQS